MSHLRTRCSIAIMRRDRIDMFAACAASSSTASRRLSKLRRSIAASIKFADAESHAKSRAARAGAARGRP